MSVQHYDLIVIGSGPAGERGATYAAGLGKRVAVIEKQSVLGGTVANQGTLPSKTLRETALYLQGYRQRGIHGLNVTLQEHVGTQDLLHRERLVRQLEQARIRSCLEHNRATLCHGDACFMDSHTLRLRAAQGREEFLTGNTILIATGASPFIPPLYPAKHPAIFDSETILHMKEFPQHLVIVGGGVIGCEYACIFAAFGVQVTLLDEGERLLPFLDHEVSAGLLASLRTQGVDVRLKEEVVTLRQGMALGLLLRSGATLTGNAILVTLRRIGNTGTLGLAAAGLAADERGMLLVNEGYQTTQSNIYAAGDVIGFPGLASAAREQAHEAMIHAFTPEKESKVIPVQPYGIYTIPECAMAGELEENLTKCGTPWISGTAHYAANARGQIIGARAGFVKLIYHKETLKLLGVHILGEQASELIHFGLLGIHSGATAKTFVELCYNYPTLNELYKSTTLDALSRRTPQAAPSGILKPRP